MSVKLHTADGCAHEVNALLERSLTRVSCEPHESAASAVLTGYVARREIRGIQGPSHSQSSTAPTAIPALRETRGTARSR